MKRYEKHKGLGIKSRLLFPWFSWHGSTHQPMMLSDHLSHHANAGGRWLTTDNHNILPVFRSNDSRVFVKKHIINFWKSSLPSTWTQFHLNSPDFSGSPNETFWNRVFSPAVHRSARALRRPAGRRLCHLFFCRLFPHVKCQNERTT